MANFTINSLSQTTIKDTDTFIKSDENGVLSKTTFGDVRNQFAARTKDGFISVTSKHENIDNNYNVESHLRGNILQVSMFFKTTSQISTSDTLFRLTSNTPLSIVSNTQIAVISNGGSSDGSARGACIKQDLTVFARGVWPAGENLWCFTANVLLEV